MSKTKEVTCPQPELPPPVVYPKSLLVVYSSHGTPDECLVTGITPSDLAGLDDPTVKVARYVLVGTGVIQHSAAQYVEHTAT